METENLDVSINGDILPTSMEGIIHTLARRGCPDLTPSINPTACSDRPLAGGGFCEVYQGTLYNGTRIAIKSLKVYDSQLEWDDEGQRMLKRAAKEIYHWRKLKHPNVLPLMGLAIFKGFISMVSGWMINGDLSSYLKRKPDADRIRLCVDICAGLCYIHKHGMVHGDLKGANIMISLDGIAMIADFGNARLQDLTLKFSHTTSRGVSYRWAAPELLLADGVPQVSMEADVYAYGMTVLETLTGKVPYEGVGQSGVMRLVAFEKKVPPRSDSGISDGLWNLLNSCWAWQPSARPTITNVSNRLEALFLADIIGSATSIEEVVDTLAKSGCPNITASIRLDACGKLPLAGGEFSDVYQGELHNDTRIAIKATRDPLYRWKVSHQKAFKRVAQELYHRSKLQHPNVLPLLGLALFRGSLSLVSEWMENGPLMSYLRLQPNTDRIKLCVDICSGLSYIHSNGMVHGNLKGANIMISRDGTAMIAGFGSARLKDSTVDFINSEDYACSVRWAAPELILDEDASLSMEADVYAYGMTVLETLNCKVPYKGISDLEVFTLVAYKQEVPPRPEMVPDGLWELLNSCWARLPSQRPKISSIGDRLKALSLYPARPPPRPTHPPTRRASTRSRDR